MLTNREKIQYFNEQRISKLQKVMKSSDIDLILIQDPRVRYWLGHPDVKYIIVTETGVEIVDNIIEFLGNSRVLVGIDAYLSASNFIKIKDSLPNTSWVTVGDTIANIMAIKDKLEVLLLKKAAQITKLVFEEIQKNLAEGVTELDLLYKAYKIMANSGGNGFSFEPSIGSGPRSELIWAGIETRALRKGDPLVVDIGVSFRGYHSDMTNSYLIGDCSNKKWKKAYNALTETLNEIQSQLRPGIEGNYLHNLCEEILSKLGYKGKMPHYLGHGIGLYIHEPPFLAPGSKDVLREGMVISVEPSIVLEEENMGIRLEKEFLITSNGCELL